MKTEQELRVDAENEIRQQAEERFREALKDLLLREVVLTQDLEALRFQIENFKVEDVTHAREAETFAAAMYRRLRKAANGNT